MQTRRSIGLYAHFPWCVKKCPYCDFNSHPLRGGLDQAGYLDALVEDLSGQLEHLGDTVGEFVIDSVFFGGGTPSLFAPEVFAALLARLEGRLAEDAEVTMEANPGTVEHHPLVGYRRAGVNRLSLGAQSFAPRQLLNLGRIHGANDTLAAFGSARAAGFDNINLDIMYGLPEQSPAEALDDLERALGLEPEHLSWYQLTLEPKTEFWARPPRLPDEGAIEAMEAGGRALIEARGLVRYEISAYARAGRRGRHNLNYWTFGDYVGIGAGAHGKLTSDRRVTRTEKPSQPRLYLTEPRRLDVRALAPETLAGEFLLNALRLVEGVPFAEFTARTGLARSTLEPRWQRWVEAGLLRSDRLGATPRGLDLIDPIIADFLG